MEEDRKASARALRTFDGAPKGYWWIVGALVALASAAMLLHESGSWMLDLAPLWGAPVNIRAFSCDAHSLGLVFGYVATQICRRRFSRLVGDGLFWLVFFIAQVGNILLFYGCLTVLDAPFVVIVVQFIGAASGGMVFRDRKSCGLHGRSHAVYGHYRDGGGADHPYRPGLVQHA